MAKVLRYGFLVVILLVIIMVLVPWLFKDQIFEKIKEEANTNLKGELVIGDVGLSLFRDFPNLTLTLDEIAFTNEAPFQNIRLFDIEKARAELDLLSVFSGEQIEILNIQLVNPNIHVKIQQNGLANYLIMNDNSGSSEENIETEESAPFKIALQSFELENLHLIYDDVESNIHTKLKGGTLVLSGNFNEEETAVETRTTIEELTVAYDGTTYLNRVLVNADVAALYNQTTGKLTLTDNAVTINALELLFSGWLQSFDEKVALDMQFEAPHADFKEVLSLIPAIYKTDFEDIETTGSFSLSGFMNGDYLYDGEDLPAFALDLNVQNATFKYPELPAAVSDINVEMAVKNPGGDADLTEINLPRASLNLAGSPFYMKMNVKRPISDPIIDFEVRSELDLTKLVDVLVLEDMMLKGVLKADAKVNGKLSDFEAQNMNAIIAEGYIQAQHLRIVTTEFKEEILIDSLNTVISPQKLVLNPLKLKIGNSDFSGVGSLNNMFGYVVSDDTLNGSFNLSSRSINVTQLMNAMATDSADSEAFESDSAVAEVVIVPGNLDLIIKAVSDEVIYDDVNLKNVSASLLVKESAVYLKNVQSDFLGGSIALNGAYKTPNGKPEVNMDFGLKNVDAQQSFSVLNTVKAFAPVANVTSGAYGGRMELSTTLSPDFTPDLNSLSAKGKLLTNALQIQPELMKTVSELLGNESFKKVRFEDADLSFEIEDGRVHVKPVNIMMGDLKSEFSGSHGLDETMDYRIKTNVSLDKIKLPKEIAALNLVKGSIPVELKIGGTLSNPQIKPVFGEAESIKDVVNQIVDDAIEQVTDSVVNTVNREAEKIIADAKLKADALKADAAKQAEQLKAEAKKQADSLKQEARKKADELVKEAKGDPLKEFAAKAASEAVIKEADKQIDKLLADANKKADELLSDANAQADAIMKEAEERAKISK